MSAWQSGIVKSNGIHLHYTRTGGNKPPLVLLHGVIDDGLCWSPVARVFEHDYDVIMLDARGHGRSDGPQSGYDPITQARDVAGMIAALNLAKPRILGHSMGAVTALVFAAMYPDLPHAIALEDPPAWWLPYEPEPDADQQIAAFINDILSLVNKPRDQMIADVKADHPHWTDAELEPWADAKQRFNQSVATSVFNALNPQTVDWQTLLPNVRCPTLVIRADVEQGGILDPAGVTALRTLIPHVQSAQIGNAGHSIRRDQFDDYMKLVQAFFADD